MISFFINLFVIVVVYFFPGFSITPWFKGKLTANIFFRLLLTFLVLPFYYLLLAYFNRLTFTNFLALNGIVWLLLRIIFTNKFAHPVDLNLIFPEKHNPRPNGKIWKRLFYGVLISFFFVVIVGKVGLWFGYKPVGDDKPQMQKVTSIAISPQRPIFYNYPVTDMTIYYFNNIPSGLVTKFSQNNIMVNQSWFIHNLFATGLLLWLIFLLATRFFERYLERFVLAFGLTFASGLEFLLYWWKKPYVDHLEWWTDWVGLNPRIHLQISSLYTLFFWVPQHLFGGLLVVPIYFIVTSPDIKKPSTQLFLGLIIGSLVGYTAFVLITLVVIYSLYLLIRLLQKNESLAVIIKNHWLVISAAFLTGLPMILLYRGAEKGSYFWLQSTVFWFFPNNLWYFKPLNLLLTAGLYLTIEFGPLLFTLIIGFYLLIKKKLYRSSWLFWVLLLYVPIWVIFLVRAADDDNISMRSLIPTQVALALISAWVVGILWDRVQNSKRLKSLLVWGIAFSCLLVLPTTIFEVYQRLQHSREPVNAVYQKIDKTLPSNSVVFDVSGQNLDFVSALGHRFSFKPICYFNVTDLEYAAIGKIKAVGLTQPCLPTWVTLFDVRKDLKNTYNFYLLKKDTLDGEADVINTDGLVVRRFTIK